MSSLIPIVASLAGLLAMQIAGYDLAVAEKWEKAKVVAYRVEGVHNAREAVVHGDYEGKADVIDRITVEFTWDCKKRKVVGPVTVTDGKTELKNVKSDGTNCPPPQLKGAYEHFQSVSSAMISGDQIQIKGTRTYPPALVSNYPGSCSMRSIPGAKEEASLFLGGAAPEALGGPIVPGGPLVIAADRKSFSMKGAENWVWTFTPTLVQ
ncbi:MAG: hypothetical protein PT977_07735 [Acidobacteriota bacterium]|nr:hypothetical protein [Acidobacteriota bacterium]